MTFEHWRGCVRAPMAISIMVGYPGRYDGAVLSRTARVRSIQNANAWAKAGVMIRESRGELEAGVHARLTDQRRNDAVLPLPPNVYIGLAVTRHNASVDAERRVRRRIARQ